MHFFALSIAELSSVEDGSIPAPDAGTLDCRDRNRSRDASDADSEHSVTGIPIFDSWYNTELSQERGKLIPSAPSISSYVFSDAPRRSKAP